MHAIRVGFPGIVGLLLLLFGWTSILEHLQPQLDRDVSLLEALAFGAIPVGLGVGFLLAAFAIARRARSGYWLGLLVAAVVALACFGLIVAEAGYLDDGGIGGAIAGPLMIVAGIAALVPIGYALELRRSRSVFAPAWGGSDRGVAVALIVVTVATLGISFAGRATSAAADVDAATDAARAEALVAATTLEARVVDVALETPAAGQPEIVRRLTLDLELQSPTTFDLVTRATLCLTDLATFKDDAYKPDLVCWGGPGPAIEVGASAGPTIPEGTSSFRVELDDATTACAFGPGQWLAELRLSPKVGSVPVSNFYSVTSEFVVPAGSPGAPLGSGPPAGVSCLQPSP